MNKPLLAKIFLYAAIATAAIGYATDVLMLTVSACVWLTAHIFWMMEIKKEKAK